MCNYRKLARLSYSLFITLGAPAFAQNIGGCRIFPSDSIFNTPVDTLPVSASSAAWIQTINPQAAAHFDGAQQKSQGGIPFSVVSATQPEVPITFTYPDQADPGPYPIPPNQPIEQGSDAHALIIDSGTCDGYEVYRAVKHNGGTNWSGDSGAIFDYLSDALRPNGWTSADAAGLPIMPLLIKYSEVAAGVINHALRFTTTGTLGGANYSCPDTYPTCYVWPARHFASDYVGPQYVPMGARIRLKASVDISGEPPQTKVILQALKTYGAFLADNGSSLYFQAAPNAHWNDALTHMGDVHGSDFEVVDESSLMVSPDSGQASPPPAK